ncbi:family 2 encapsulin nanocompartment cargo protein terpene cyclase [Streptomyces ipomoeae]|uniref:family 2 encapsulin nanocompartment cargo protein terpene cyclase n=1 Tax=Streptomyces ipomoeae TaxID=103232 RepID=UPI0015F0F792|nr:family 2 encapsulin nanocompartment cargo protein terpene cyclase [Streptomyces ipomoeae]MDX2937310.1 family 2 encapsulin nanocompartment cargo protein terpene cyclase [Streptomyces ipomoeae]
MSLISRAAAPAAGHDVAGLVRALLSAKPAASARLRPVGSRSVTRPPSRRTLPLPVPHGPGTSAARLAEVMAGRAAGAFLPASAQTGAVRAEGAGPSTAVRSRGAGLSTAVRPSGPALPIGPTGLGTSGARLRIGGAPPQEEPPQQDATSDKHVRRLHCPPAVRDDRALGETVTERLVEWADEVGIYPGQLDKIRRADFGRLIMLAHPESDDPDRLLAAAKCALSEWAVDDHYVDGEVEEARHDLLGQRLAIAHSVIDQANLPLAYAPQLEEAVQADPVCRALRSGLDDLARYATTTQVRRLRHELGIMFVAYGQEGVWHTTGQTPPVWEFLMHRHENSFIPCMVLVDAIAGYEVPQAEFADPRVRRAFTLAGTASVIVNDLYSMGKEDPTDFSLPRLIAIEDQCSLEEAVDRTVDIHNELMLTFEAEAAALAATGSPELRRFFASTWAWVGGSREWHASSGRYATAD